MKLLIENWRKYLVEAEEQEKLLTEAKEILSEEPQFDHKTGFPLTAPAVQKCFGDAGCRKRIWPSLVTWQKKLKGSLAEFPKLNNMMFNIITGTLLKGQTVNIQPHHQAQALLTALNSVGPQQASEPIAGGDAAEEDEATVKAGAPATSPEDEATVKGGPGQQAQQAQQKAGILTKQIEKLKNMLNKPGIKSNPKAVRHIQNQIDKLQKKAGQ